MCTLIEFLFITIPNQFNNTTQLLLLHIVELNEPQTHNKSLIHRNIFDWKNNITITFIDQNEVAHIFKLTNKGFWKQQFEFSNLKDEIVIVLTPLNTWKKWTNGLAIESSLNYSNQKYFDELVIYCGFVVRLIQQYAGAGVV